MQSSGGILPREGERCLTVAKFETAAAHMLQCRITPTASTFGHATIESWDIAQNCLCARSGMALIR